MADDDLQPSAAPSPMLQKFAGAFTDPAAKQWAGHVTTILNNFFQQRRLAVANQQAGENFVNDVNNFKSGLIKFVQADPTATHTALDLVHPTMAGIIGSMPGAPEDAADHHAALSAEIQHDIAHAAVVSAAERNARGANALLDNERIAGVLGDSVSGLRTYTNLQENARQSDNLSQQVAAQQAQERQGHQSAINYLTSLINPETKQVQFPDGWNQGVMADNKLPPAAKIMVASTYNNLRVNGDAPSSNPFLVHSLLKELTSANPPTVPEMLQYAGNDLKAEDALHLANIAHDPTQKDHATDLANAVGRAAETYATPENGAAGANAFNRFVNWLLPQSRTGNIVLDEGHPDYALTDPVMQKFAPTPSDAVSAAVAPMASVSLGDIFGRSANAEMRVADEHSDLLNNKIDKIQGMENRRMEDEAGGSGTFFQDLLKKGGGAPIPLVPGPEETS